MATSKTPAAKKPAAKKPTAKKPTVKKAAVKKPVAKKLAAKKPATRTSAAPKKPAAKKATRVVRPIPEGETRNCYLLRLQHPEHGERHVYSTPEDMILCVEAMMKRARSDVGPGAAFVEGDVLLTTIEEGDEGAVNDVKDFLQVKIGGTRWRPYREASGAMAALVVDNDDCWPWAFELKLDEKALVRRLKEHRKLESPWLAEDEEMTATVHHPTEKLTLRQGSFKGDGVAVLRSPVWSARP